MNRRTAEQGTAEYRSKKIALLLSKTSAVRNSLFDIRYSKYKTGWISLQAGLAVRHNITSDLAIEL
jgi:hypothetical protein